MRYDRVSGVELNERGCSSLSQYDHSEKRKKPVRVFNSISRCSAKLYAFGIDIHSIHAEGYILTTLRCYP
jgi:hypothetical protein